MRIEALFPTPLGIFEYPEPEAARRLLLEWIGPDPRRYYQNDRNITLEEFELHRLACMTDLSRFFCESVRTYSEMIGQQVPDFVITQCWLNLNRPGESHHRHFHPNSFLSGVYYLDAEPTSGHLVFHRPGVRELDPAWVRETPFSSDFWKLEPRSGLLLLFPSRLEHSVEVNRSNSNRLSISFNTMFRGTVGSHLQRVDFGR